MTSQNKVDNIEKAKRAWKDTPGGVPEWILELAARCNATSQTAVARKIGYSAPTVSQVLSNTYLNGNLKRFQEMVEGAFMAYRVPCPILGEIGRNRCLDEQQQPFRPTSAYRAQLYHACRNGCPYSRTSGGEGGAQ